MTVPTRPTLETGRVYRTGELSQWTANAPRLAKRLERDGQLVRLAQGLYVHPKRGRFGVVPPSDDELMRGFLSGAPFVLTGSTRWNDLGLGSTAVFATQLVYNTKQSGSFDFGGRRFLLRRVAFPVNPPPEWFVVDLMEHTEQAGVSLEVVTSALSRALQSGRFDGDRLMEMASAYGTRATELRVRDLLQSEALAV